MRGDRGLASIEMVLMMPVALVTWSMRRSLVLPVTAESTRSTTSVSDESGNGTEATTTFAPHRSATKFRTLRHALYS